MSLLHNSLTDRCRSICGDSYNCIAVNKNHVNCIADIISGRLGNMVGIINLLMSDNCCGEHKKLLTSALRDMLVVSEWVKAIQKNKGLYSDNIVEMISEKRMCPRFAKNGVSAIINGKTYEIADLSITGCFIATPNLFSIDSTIPITLILEGHEINIIAEVVRLTQYGVGCRFDRIDDADESMFFSLMSDFFLSDAQFLAPSDKGNGNGSRRPKAVGEGKYND